MRYFLGVDGGGTKTHALIADETGQTIGFGQVGSGNPEGVGYDGLSAVLQDSVSQALHMAELKKDAIAGAGIGVAGYDWPSQLEPTLESIQTLSLSCPLEVVNDTVIALTAGTSQGVGLALIAGTGNNCRGRDRFGREGRITGNGEMFGEYGGSSEIVMKAIQAVDCEWIRRGPATQITGRFLEMSGATDIAELIEGIVLGRYRYDAADALAVFQAAYEGDTIAREIITWAGCELGESAAAVIRQLGIENEEFEVVMAGSTFNGGSLYIEPLCETIQKVAPKAKLVRLEAPPVVGGVLLGLENADLIGYPLRETLITSTNALIKRINGTASSPPENAHPRA